MSQTMEKSKSIKLSVGSIIKKIDKQTIRFDHPLQRESERWSKIMRSNLISDILQNNPVPALIFAEQVVNNIPIIWDLDGKQRCTNVYSFVKNEFAISKKVNRYIIDYHVPVLDVDGKPVFDDDNFPLYERKEFDIRNKKFSQLPEELQDRILDYSFEIVQYLNCSSLDIAYHIERYNNGKPANTAEKGVIKLGEKFAECVKDIASLPFFRDNYTGKEINNGSVSRIIVEAVMLSDFYDNWNNNYDNICRYIKDNATKEHFEAFEELINRFDDTVDPYLIDEILGKNKKNSFLWLTLFSRFVSLGIEDENFNYFMEEFNKTLHGTKIDGVSFDDMMENSSTKDKSVVRNRIDFLTKLMYKYFGINGNKEEEESEEILVDGENDDLQKFAMNFESDEQAIRALMLTTDSPYNNFEPETMRKVVEWYGECGNKEALDDCLFYKSFLDGVVDETDINLPLYTYAVKYIDSNNIDVDIDEWLSEFKETAFKEIDGDVNNDPISNSTIMLKESEIIKNINNFLQKEKK